MTNTKIQKYQMMKITGAFTKLSLTIIMFHYTQPVETKSETNNVFVPHPTLGKETLVPFGMYIQPTTMHIGEKKIGGYKIIAMKDLGLAEQSKLL